MTIDSHGYVTEVTYRPGFHPEQTPAAMRLAAALSGFPVPVGDGYDALELGAGPGRTLAVLAASNPRSRFVGVDLLPEHVAEARALADAAGLSNVRYEQGDIAELRGEELGAFDYVIAHGVYTWITPPLRERMIDIAAAALRPGGLFYASYNALPGWCSASALRRLLIDVASRTSGDVSARALQSVQYAELLRQNGAAFFAQNPLAAAMVVEMPKHGASYVLHEYFNEGSGAVWFSDTAEAMARRDLHFVASLPLHLNYRDLALPPQLVPLFKNAQDRLWFEVQKDFATNACFRRDVYVKGQVACAPSSADEYLTAEAFATISPTADTTRSARLPFCTMNFVGTIFDAMLEVLGEGPATVGDIAARPSLAAFSRRQLLDALRNLLIGNIVLPMRPHAPIAPPRLNQLLLDRASAGDGNLALASELAATGIVLAEGVVAGLKAGKRPPAATRLRLV